MKIEKLTENKIRVIINSNELGLNHISVHSLMTKALETQEIFSDILKKAEKEVNFYTDGCKLLIETFSSLDDIFVFTITKYLPENDTKKKKLTAKRKSFNKISQHSICRFETFDTFCHFCNKIKCLHRIDVNKLAKNTALYLWKDTYFLVLRDIHTSCDEVNLFYSALSEFGKPLSFSDNFESKLLEHGKVVIKKDAIRVGIKYFVV